MNFAQQPQSQTAPATRDELLAATDEWLAAVVAGGETRWKAFPTFPGWDALVSERIVFHGIAGLLAERRGTLERWPDTVMHRVRDLAIEQAMWEMLHKLTVGDALTALAAAGVEALVLKGTAMAYTLYERPAQRFRGDTDILIGASQRGKAGEVLGALEFERVSANDEMKEDLEELWVFAGPDGSQHKIDLHWQAMDAPALEGFLPYEACLAGAMPLDRLGSGAQRMDFANMLLHAIVHRAKHRVSPYFADGKAYHDADRLIWLYDFDLLARALDEQGWKALCRRAWRYDVAPVCIEALDTASRMLGTVVPAEVMASLREAPQETATTDYLINDRQLGRSWKNFMALDGWGRKLSYIRGKVVPSRAFMRGKYPQYSRMPLPLLYLWRIAELFVKRPRDRG